MIPSLCYLISSNASYAEPLQRLLKSMEGIETGCKFVVVGGYNPGVFVLNRTVGVTVNHNSFDYTAIVEWVERVVEDKHSYPSHIFLLHDTMEFTPETDSLVRSADPEMDATAAVDGGQCNLCLFRTDYLLTKREQILKMRNCTKLEAVQFEGVLWKDAPRRAVYPNATVDVLGEEKVYGGLPRRIEFYRSVGIRKFKASCGQDMENIHTRIKP